MIAEGENYKLVLGDCWEYMLGMESGNSVIVADVPYGAKKAEWDSEYPQWFYRIARQVSKRVCIITGSVGLKDSIASVGYDFVDVIAGRNLNGMTRGPMGFMNWIACVVALSKPKQTTNCFEFSVCGDMPEHPSPKPIQYMLKLIERVTEPGDLVFDPFMGSGTTGVACMQLGRRFVGVEIDPAYFAIAKRRIAAASAQPLLIPPARMEKMEQARF